MVSANTQVEGGLQDAPSITSTVNMEPHLQQKTHSRLENVEMANLFRKLWPCVTDDNHLTLFGFRRFRTTHLMNLRFLEEEINKIDRQIYQAGLKLGIPPTKDDRLGSRYSKRDASAQGLEESINQDLLLRLRDLVKLYGMLCSSWEHLHMLIESLKMMH